MFNINKPVTNPSLVNAMNRLKEDSSPENNNAVINEVMEAEFLVPVQIKPEPKINEDGNTIFKENSQMAFGSIEDQDNNLYYLAFTDWDELKKWNDEKDQQTIALSFENMAELIEDNPFFSGLVINPFGHSIPFKKEMMNDLIQQKNTMNASKSMDKEFLEEDSILQLKEVNKNNDQLLNPVIEYFKEDKRINSAYLNLMIKEDNSKSYIMVVDMEEEEYKDDIFKNIAHIIRPNLKDYPLDMITSKYDLGKSIMEDTKAFYKR